MVVRQVKLLRLLGQKIALVVSIVNLLVRQIF